MRLRLAFVTLVVSPLFSSVALACLRPPAELIVHHRELIKRANWIALARFDRVERFEKDGGSEYRRHFLRNSFTTIEAIKGKPGSTFTQVFSDRYAFVKNRPATPYKDRPNADFHSHTDWEFWENHASRQWNGADCEMHPEFEVGASYLIIEDSIGHWKAYERIDHPDDRWLAAVRAVVADPTKPSGYSLTLAAYLKAQESVFFGKAIRCHEDAKWRHPLYPKDELVAYVHTIDKRESFPPAKTATVRVRGPHQCTVGQWHLGVIQRGDITTVDGEIIKQARLIPLFDDKHHEATTFSDDLRIDITALGSEALVTTDATATVTRIRQLVAPPAAKP